MCFAPDYFEEKKITVKDSSYTNENYLKDFDSLRQNKILKRFSGVTMTLNDVEKTFLSDYFEYLKY